MNARKLGLFGLLALAFAPKQDGAVGTAQKAARLPVNLLIIGLLLPVVLLFTSLWWVGLLGIVGWGYAAPKLVRKVKALTA